MQRLVGKQKAKVKDSCLARNSGLPLMTDLVSNVRGDHEEHPVQWGNSGWPGTLLSDPIAQKNKKELDTERTNGEYDRS